MLEGEEMNTQEITKLSDDLKYLRDEFEAGNQLWGSCPDGYVTLDAMIEYCKENDYLLEHIIKVAKQVNAIEVKK